MSQDDTAAQTYHQATGQWPEGYTPPGQHQEALYDPEKDAAEAYYRATGRWPGEAAPQQEQVEAPEDRFSHYLVLANGQTKRYAVDDNDPTAPPPASFNGVPVVSVHNAYAPS